MRPIPFLSLVPLALASIARTALAANAPYSQCGGQGFSGETSCVTGYECKQLNPYYSQCVPDTSNSPCNQAYGQCGGKTFTGETCCIPGYECVKANAWYSQCLPKHRSGAGSQSSVTQPKSSVTTTKTKTTAKTTSTKSTPKPTTTTVKTTKTTTTIKAVSTTVKTKSTTTTTKTTTKTTSKAVPTTPTTKVTKTTTTTTKAVTTTQSSGGSSATYAPVPGGASGSGSTTRYWDCCKASCSWPGKASVSSPVGTCAKDGITLVDANTQSACVGGSAYMCNDNQPWAINDQLSYGFAAASIVSQNEASWCCACYELTFTSGAVAGKKMVVQVTNTGGDLGQNHFDLQIPGGGVGIFNGCQSQWNAPADGWGQRYGGLSDVSGCSSLPSHLQAGCNWRFNWFKNADNPSMTFKQVTCPAELVKRTGCQRN